MPTECPTPERIQELRRLHEMRDGIFPPQCWCGIDWPCPVAEVLAALDGAEEGCPANCERCGKTAEFVQVCSDCHWTEMQKVEALERRLGEARRGIDSALCLLVEGVEFIEAVPLRAHVQGVLTAALKASEEEG